MIDNSDAKWTFQLASRECHDHSIESGILASGLGGSEFRQEPIPEPR